MQGLKTYLRSTVATLAVLGTTCSAVAQAQAPAPETSKQRGLEEVVVTAQRRVERLQNVPVSVSALNSKQLTAAGVTGVANLTVAVPAVSVQNGNGYLLVHLHGIGAVANGPGFENPVALYIDGVYYANQSIGLEDFNNIQRVEVLKGPQGTLFGRNATGGLINIITQTPDQTPHFNASIGYGNYNATDTSLYGSGPLAPDLAGDFAFRFSRHDGWGTNSYNDKDVYAVNHDLALRSKLAYTPGDWRVTLITDFTDRLDSSNALADRAGSLTLPGLPPAHYSQPWDVDTNIQPRLHVRGGGVSIKAERDIGDVTVSDQAAYRASSFDNHFDYDGSYLPLLDVHINQHDWQVSNELQVASRSSSPLTWVGGLYYFHAEGSMEPLAVDFAPTPQYNGSFPLGGIVNRGTQTTDSISAFGQATYHITPQIGITGGMRYTGEERQLDAGTNGFLLLPGEPSIVAVPVQHKIVTFSNPSFRGSIDYKPVDNLLLYASVNTGFKSGGYNVTDPAAPYYRPEHIIAYEIGEKTDLLDRHLRLNASLFDDEYKDIQVQVAELAGTGFTNGAAARIYGADFDATYKFDNDLQFTGGLSLLHADYHGFLNAPTGVPGGGYPVGTASADGHTLPFSPKATFTLGATYNRTIANNDFSLNATLFHSASFYFEPDNIARQPQYNQVNANLTWIPAVNRRFNVTFYGQNLTDKSVLSVVLTEPAGQEIALLQAPRTYGVRVGYAF